MREAYEYSTLQEYTQHLAEMRLDDYIQVNFKIVAVYKKKDETKILECNFGIDNCCNNKDGYCTVKENIEDGKTCIEEAAWRNPY